MCRWGAYLSTLPFVAIDAREQIIAQAPSPAEEEKLAIRCPRVLVPKHRFGETAQERGVLQRSPETFLRLHAAHQVHLKSPRLWRHISRSHTLHHRRGR